MKIETTSKTGVVLNIINDFAGPILLLVLGTILLSVLTSFSSTGLALVIVLAVLMVWMFFHRKHQLR